LGGIADPKAAVAESHATRMEVVKRILRMKFVNFEEINQSKGALDRWREEDNFVSVCSGEEISSRNGSRRVYISFLRKTSTEA
jgi:hypothetical protein